MAEMSPQDQELLDCVKKRVEHFERTLGAHYRDNLWTRMDRLYHGYAGIKRALKGTRGRERDDILNDARSEFGHALRIPHAYAIVETVVPALLSNRPRILVLPRNEASTKNVEHMKATIDAQQDSINLELTAQPVAKSALTYGLGVGKSYWLTRMTQKQKLVETAWYQRALGNKWAVETCAEPLFDDPTFDHVPVRDFFWDPFAASIERARWAAHRTWRDTAYVNDRLEDPNGWNRVVLAPADIESTNGSAERYRKSVHGPFDAQGIPVPNSSMARDADWHEVIEYHDGGQVITVLDRQWVVAVGQNESWYGRLPFHIYRPTEVLNQFVGKGEIEPNEDLIGEMDDIRTDRRWAAAMALAPPLFAQEGMVDPDKVRVGPGEINMVNGDPHDLILQMQINDVPASSWRETAEIAADIVRTSGISDSFAGGDGGSADTATGVQLQLARASARIQLKTHRLELELFKPLGRHWLAMNQRHIIEARDVQLPAPPIPGEPERRWAWFKVGPNELAGEFDIEIDGGSTAPENVPQKRQDAQIKMTLLQGPVGQLLDQRQMVLSLLDDLGMKNPETLLAPGNQPIPPEALQVIAQQLVQVGMDPQEAQELIQESVQQAMEAMDQQAQATDHGQGDPSQQAPAEQQAA